MEKRDCSCSFERSREVTILGKPVRVKNTICARDGGGYRLKPDPAPAAAFHPAQPSVRRTVSLLHRRPHR